MDNEHESAEPSSLLAAGTDCLAPFTPVQEEVAEWKFPSKENQRGGVWLIGSRVKLYWEDDDEWYEGRVLDFISTPQHDSHGQFGCLHKIEYVDGIFSEVIDENTVWQYLADAKTIKKLRKYNEQRQSSLAAAASTSKPSKSTER